MNELDACAGIQSCGCPVALEAFRRCRDVITLKRGAIRLFADNLTFARTLTRLRTTGIFPSLDGVGPQNTMARVRTVDVKKERVDYIVGGCLDDQVLVAFMQSNLLARHKATSHPDRLSPQAQGSRQSATIGNTTSCSNGYAVRRVYNSRQQRHDRRATHQVATGFTALRDQNIDSHVTRVLCILSGADRPDHRRACVLRKLDVFRGIVLPHGNDFHPRIKRSNKTLFLVLQKRQIDSKLATRGIRDLLEPRHNTIKRRKGNTHCSNATDANQFRHKLRRRTACERRADNRFGNIQNFHERRGLHDFLLRIYELQRLVNRSFF
ncbi:hypothetical protein K788_0000545 [Paraburkholderia caribensis MBA4]|uniref:Uncharacterized protein n=1 Tax=Paraburkholderia caribensis MBA4 TaxID=1323664 RepID=A0A0P0RIE3_9BURK|nr:hypothetical protein K788_0000545 [Paraburkholderia caribensis MBA4]